MKAIKAKITDNMSCYIMVCDDKNCSESIFLLKYKVKIMPYEIKGKKSLLLEHE